MWINSQLGYEVSGSFGVIEADGHGSSLSGRSGKSKMRSRNALLKLGVSAVWVIAPCISQAQIQPPPRHDARSPTGVSYRSGNFTFEEEDLSVGGGMPNGLALVRSYNSGSDGLSDPFVAAVGWTQSFNIYVSVHALPQEPEFEPAPNYHARCVYDVVGGSRAAGFLSLQNSSPRQTGCGGTGFGFTGITKTGASLAWIGTPSPGHYKFTEFDGSVIEFTPGSNARASTWTRPDGTRLEFTYSSGVIRSVFSNRGWAILFESSLKACAVNLAQTYVTPTSSCPSDAQTVTYSYGPGTYVTSWMLMTGVTKGGNTRTYGYASNDHVNCIKDPGQTACRISNTYYSCPVDPHNQYKQPQVHRSDPVTSQQDGTGRTYSYSYSIFRYGENDTNLCPQWSWITDPDYRPFSPMTTTITETGVAGNTTVETDPASQVRLLTNPLGRSFGFSYQDSSYEGESGEPTGFSMPESNGEEFTRDSRGNVTSRIVKPKPGSGLPDLVTSAVFEENCSSIITCNKPTSVTDPRGNVTEFSYDPDHGGVSTETSPADANGIQAVKRYTYVTRSAWLKNSSGGYTASAYPVWLLSEVRSCRRTATIRSACAGGSNDEVKTSYEYGPDAGPNNLLMRGQVVTADGTSRRTCYSYDRDGRRISESLPNANLTSCP